MNGSHLIQIAIGAFIFYLASGFSNNFGYYNSKEFETKNFWTGYVASIIAFLVFIILII